MKFASSLKAQENIAKTATRTCFQQTPSNLLQGNNHETRSDGCCYSHSSYARVELLDFREMERPTQHLRHIPRQTGDQSDESARLSQHSTIEVEDQASISSHEASSPAPRQNQITAHSYSSIHGDKKQHYKPISTKTSILCTFFVASLLFIAGIEFVVRHSIPIMPPTAKSISSGQPLLGKAMVKSPFEGLVHDVLPSYTDRLVVKNCIGIEMIISKTNNNTIPSTFTQPIYNVPVSTMPCYACAMQSQGIIAKGFVTATTVSVISNTCSMTL